MLMTSGDSKIDRSVDQDHYRESKEDAIDCNDDSLFELADEM